MPNLSVIIPTHNRAGQLRACLEALSRQTAPASDFEVVVVVDGARDGTEVMLGELTTPYRLRFIVQPQAGPGAARNQGAECASGEYCLFLDDDIIAEKTLVAEHLRVQCEEGGCIGLGHMNLELPVRPDPFARFFRYWWRRHYARLQTGEHPLFTDCFSGNLSVPRTAFMAVGGFATDLPRSEDVELGFRLLANELPLRYIPTAAGKQQFTKGFAAISRDAYLAGVASVALYERHSSLLPWIELGSYSETSLRALLLRRLFLRLRVPQGFLQFLTRLAGARLGHEWYRFLHAYWYWRGVQDTVRDDDLWNRLTRGPLVLMYHRISASNSRRSRYVLPVRRFEKQMAWLRRSGRPVLALSQYLMLRRLHELPPGGSVILTFDDGYTDFIDHAMPVLRQYGYPMTLFAIAGRPETRSAGDSTPVEDLLSWTELRRLAEDGVEMGSHGLTHRKLTELTPREAAHEIRGSRTALEEATGAPVRVFAYPFGKRDATVDAMVASSGYDGACGVHPGPNGPATPGFRLRRTEVRGTDSLLRFRLMLWLS